MAKWLAAGAVGVIALLVLLWMQIREPAAAVTPAPKREVAQAAAPAPMKNASDLAIAAQKMREVQEHSGKLDPASDAFIYHFDEAVPPMLTMQAAKCYTGGLNRVHRNQKTKLKFDIAVKNGVVSVSNVKVAETTISDKALNDCFVREVAKVSWTDDMLPDWTQKDEELLIRPERGMKKFTKDNLAYEGEGPIGKLESAGPVAASREQPLDERDADTKASQQP